MFKVLDEVHSPHTSNGRFNMIFTKNDRLSMPERRYLLTVPSIPESLSSHPDHNLWQQFLFDQYHLISNLSNGTGFTDDNPIAKIFERWKAVRQNG